VNRDAYIRSPTALEGVPFAGDDLGGRKDIADRLTHFLGRLRAGCVIAIDAPWGAGKTWFGQNWRGDLQSKGFRTAWLNAYEHDYAEDPFIPLAAEFAALAGPGAKTFRTRAAAVGKRLLPDTAKIVLHVALDKTLGAAGAKALKDMFKGVPEELGGLGEKIVRERLDNHANQRASVDAFQKSLRDFAGESADPIVFFVDELDRCRPDFAVRVLERLKHFFDVEGLVFVLLLNRSQLEAAIRGIYGTDTDAPGYLSKFFQLSLNLPVSRQPERAERAIESYCNAIARRYKHPEAADVLSFIQILTALALPFALTLRDIERTFVLYEMAWHQGCVQRLLLAYFIVLKIKRADLFESAVVQNTEAGHREAESMLRNLVKVWPDNKRLPQFLAYHMAGVQGFTRLDPGIAQTFELVFSSAASASEIVRIVAESVALPDIAT